MPSLDFTDRTLRALKPEADRVDYWDASVPGPGLFGLRVSAAGVKSWNVVYRHQGRLRRHTFARFPAKGYAAAREEGRDLLAKARLGQDPAGEKRATRESDRQTVRAMFNAYQTHAEARRKAGEFRSWPQIRLSLERDVLPEWGTRPTHAIRRKDVLALITAKALAGKIAANRLQAHVSMLFAFGTAHDWCPGNPVAGLRKRPEHPRERVLSDEELRGLWRYLHGTAPIELVRGVKTKRVMPADTAATLRDVFIVLLLTGQRIGETSRMAWSDVDLDARRWTIPASETKNGRAHNVPLTGEALAVLQRRREAAASTRVWVFPATASGTGSVHLWSKRAASAISRVVGFAFTAHDLRRTCATRLGDLGLAGDTIDAILNHARAGVLRHYDHSTREKQKRSALDRWSRELDRIITEAPSKVIPIRA